MTRKLLKFSGIGFLFAFLLLACRADIDESFKNDNSNYLSKSLWKEDKVYIENVKTIFEKDFNQSKFYSNWGKVSWDYATTFGTFNESILEVPIIKDNKVLSVMLVKRNFENNKVYFSHSEDLESISYYQNLMFSKRKILPKKQEMIDNSNSTARYQTVIRCFTNTFEVGCLNGEECVPLYSTTTTCKSYLEYIDDDNSGGGGSGGSDIDNGYDYPYGGGSTSPSNGDPCDKVNTYNIKAKELLADDKIKKQKETAIRDIKTNNYEKSFTFGKNNDGIIQVSEIKDGSSSSAPMPATDPNFTVHGGAHTHDFDSYNVPSSGDIYKFYKNHKENSSYNYYFTFSQDSNNYVYTIVDQTKFDNFIKDHPDSAANFDLKAQNWSETSEIGKAFVNILGNFTGSNIDIDNQLELTMAAMISKFDMGIALAKEDANGDFKGIYVNQIIDSTDPTKITYTKTTDCNLKK